VIVRCGPGGRVPGGRVPGGRVPGGLVLGGGVWIWQDCYGYGSPVLSSGHFLGSGLVCPMVGSTSKLS